MDQMKSGADGYSKANGADTGSEMTGQALPPRFYGLMTQIMLYVKTLDEDYVRYREREQE